MNQILNLLALAGLPAAVKPPAFEPAGVETSIVHLGIGAFHRAQMAWYTQTAMEKSADTNWGIQGVSFHSTEIRDQLARQGFLYALVSKNNQQQFLEIIGSVRDIVCVKEDPGLVPELIAGPGIKIVSLTVTEKGYCHDPVSGKLDESHPGIVQDLRQPEQPTTAIGVIVEGLKRRRLGNAGPITVLSCDNLPANGKTLQGLVTRYCELIYPDLLQWIDTNVSFPSTMVDRIVPATTVHDQQQISACLKVIDLAPVVAEVYSLWVIEDDFKAGRPAWETVGVKFVGKIEAYETMKLRLLNGPHSACAYLGDLAGFASVAELMAEPAFPRFLRRMMEQEIIPGLDSPAKAELDSYKDSVLQRFSNTALAHKTRQIAMDGSQKLPQRLLNSVRSALEKELPIDCLALSIAAWMRYVTGVDESGQLIEVSDPMAEELQKIATKNQGKVEDLAQGFLSLEGVFSRDLCRSPRFVTAVVAALDLLYRQGALASIKHTVN